MILTDYLFIVGFAFVLLIIGQLKGVSFRVGLLLTLGAGLILTPLGGFMLGDNMGISSHSGSNVTTYYTYNISGMVSSTEYEVYSYTPLDSRLNLAVQWITFIAGLGVLSYAFFNFKTSK